MLKVIKYLKGYKMNNFKDYGFEADFEGKILSDIEGYYIGYYVESYPCIKEKQKIPTFWNKNTGNCYKGAGVSNSKFSLKPIKKEWYEKEDNFRIAVKQIKSLNDFTNKDGEIGIMEKFTDDNGISVYVTDGYHTPVQWLECYRPATKEEVLDLLVKD